MKILFLLCHMLLRKRLGFVFLLVLLVGCGSNISAPSKQKSPVLPTHIAFDVGGTLHIDSFVGIICSVNRRQIAKTILLSSDEHVTYDVGELQQMKTYIDATINGVTGSTDSGLPPPISSITALSVIPVNAAGTSSSADTECGGTLEITNIGGTDVQLSQINLRLTKDVVNSGDDHYRLINVCSLPSEPVGCAFRASGGGGGTFEYTYQLVKNARASTLFHSQLDVDTTLKHGEVVVVHLRCISNDPGTYSLIPEITVDTMGSQMSFALPKLAATLAFAPLHQFSCYTLQNTTFVLQSKLTTVYGQPDLHQSAQESTWCL